MNNYTKKNSILLAFILVVCLSGCTSDPVTSFNRYIIDNHSSTVLFYNTGSGLDERTIEIAQLNHIEIEVTEYDGDSVRLIPAEEFFVPTENAIYLLKEVNGNLMEALQLNTTVVLNWHTEMVNEFTFNHILRVTDEMLN